MIYAYALQKKKKKTVRVHIRCFFFFDKCIAKQFSRRLAYKTQKFKTIQTTEIAQSFATK